MNIACSHSHEIIVSWDNFDYSQTVWHQTLCDFAKHISVITGKLCISHCMSSGDLCWLMLHIRVALDSCQIYQAADNQNDEILHACQCYWITEVICYTHSAAIEKLFNDQDSITIDQAKQSVNHAVWSELSIIECLLSCKIPHCALDSILENENTISDIYGVINTVFEKQLKCDCEKVFDSQLYLVYDDQKTVSLIHSVQKKQQKVTL